ncbi:MAG: hypothetical protein LBM38_05535 [Clostridiales bacterium]|jgi:hypothetical protein|nr:hypothetical protein [Clostridiales bacterium]
MAKFDISHYSIYNTYFIEKRNFQLNDDRKVDLDTLDYDFINSLFEGKSVGGIWGVLKEVSRAEKISMKKIITNIKDQKVLETMLENNSNFYKGFRDFEEFEEQIVNNITDENVLRKYAYRKDSSQKFTASVCCIKKLLAYDLKNRPLTEPIDDEQLHIIGPFTSYDENNTILSLYTQDNQPYLEGYAYLEEGKPIRYITDLPAEKLNSIVNFLGKLHFEESAEQRHLKDTRRDLVPYASLLNNKNSVIEKMKSCESESISQETNSNLSAFKTACKQAGVDDAQLAKIVDNYNKLISIQR